MELTPAQQATLKADILAKAAPGGVFEVWYPANEYGLIAQYYNAAHSPDFWAYRTGIDSGEIGKTVNYVAVAAMTTANLQRVSDFLRMNLVSFNGRDDVKTFLNDTFSGALGGQGQATRDALDLMLRRKASRIERLFATGTGASTTPGTTVFIGEITHEQCMEAARS